MALDDRRQPGVNLGESLPPRRLHKTTIPSDKRTDDAIRIVLDGSNRCTFGTEIASAEDIESVATDQLHRPALQCEFETAGCLADRASSDGLGLDLDGSLPRVCRRRHVPDRPRGASPCPTASRIRSPARWAIQPGASREMKLRLRRRQGGPCCEIPRRSKAACGRRRRVTAGH